MHSFHATSRRPAVEVGISEHRSHVATFPQFPEHSILSLGIAFLANLQASQCLALCRPVVLQGDGWVREPTAPELGSIPAAITDNPSLAVGGQPQAPPGAPQMMRPPMVRSLPCLLLERLYSTDLTPRITSQQFPPPGWLPPGQVSFRSNRLPEP